VGQRMRVQYSPIPPQKSPTPPQKSPVYLQKSATPPHTSPTSPQKSPVCLQKSSVSPLPEYVPLTACGDVTCSAATTSASYTPTPLPTITAGNSTWGNRYIDPGISSSKDMLIYIYVYIHECGMYKSVLF